MALRFWTARFVPFIIGVDLTFELYLVRRVRYRPAALLGCTLRSPVRGPLVPRRASAFCRRKPGAITAGRLAPPHDS